MKSVIIRTMNTEKASGPILSIACITYNQEQYIRQCLDGFLIQKTNFPYEIVIHDDASTDRTQAIILEYCEKYPNLFRPILQKENKYKEGKGILARFVFSECKGKYIALCEGDDYWTDPLKLQKQVDFLESHSDFVMVSHDYDVFLQSLTKYENNKNTHRKVYTLSDLISGFWPAQTLTVVFKKDAILSYGNFQGGDVALFYFLLKSGKGFFIDDNMATYRIHDSGVWGGLSDENRIKQSFDSRLSIYDVDNSVEAANYILSVFKLPIPSKWYFKERRQLSRLLRVMARHIKPFVILKVVCVNFLKSFKH